MFKGYISNTIGHVRWIIHNQQTFLTPCLRQIPDILRGQAKGITGNLPLIVLRQDRYKVLGEFEITHADTVETYLIKAYKYPHLSQKIKQFFKSTRAFHEFKTTCVAAMKGVPVEVPIAYGERKRLFAKESYLIIRKIKHCYTTREYFKSTCSLKERRDILRKFGNLARNIHDSGVKQDDFSLDNFLVYSNGTGEKRIILIDFERVSIQTKSLSEKHRVWYLAKLNRAKRGFTNTDRLRFLLSYTSGNFDYCKELAKQIEPLTVRIQKKDAQKFWGQCIHKNRKFGIFKNAGFFGFYRKSYSLETMITLLNTVGESTQDVFYRNQFQIYPKLNYGTVIHAWMDANALYALGIAVLVPIGAFIRCFPASRKEGFLISLMPDNCVPLHQHIGLYPDKNPILLALSRFADQVSPFGIFTKDLNVRDILVQTNGNRLTCYLGNSASFRMNRHSREKNRTVNKHIVKQLLPMNVTLIIPPEQRKNHNQ